jgi:predicted AlkP superfamily pyrophosphatase or phosphodiesterase
VLVVIDQWPTWAFEKQKALFTGGLARLIREGAIVDAAELPYANTFTAPGHATIATGAPPRVTGIVGNYWYRRAEGRDRPAEYDGDATPLTVAPALGEATLSADDGSSAKALRVDGVADALRAGTGGAGKSIAIALKSRAACLVAGQHPDLAVWYEPGAGGMTTSPAYAANVPAWLAGLTRTAPPSRYFGATWDPRDRALLERTTGFPDAAPGEDSAHGLGAAFPHTLGPDTKPQWAIQETPFADELVAQTAAVALDGMQIGRDEVPDFVAISFSAHDYASHDWGQDSWESLDLTLRLDGLLGELFSALDARVGEHNWAVVVTSDHGATPLVERSGIAGARRISPLEVEQVAEQAIAGALGQPGPWVAKLISNNLYLTQKFGELSAAQQSTALDAAVRAIQGVKSIGGAQRTDTLSADCTTEKDVLKLVCNARVPGESGEIYVWPARGSVFTDSKFGSGHDSPSEDNRHVPILVKAPGVKPQHGTGSLLQVAPTLSALLGVPPPSAATMPPLFGIVRR